MRVGCDLNRHPLDHFGFLKTHARVTPKMTIPAPSTFHFRQGRALISREVYPDLDGYFDDVATVISGGLASTLALEGSTEEEQFQ